MRWWSWLPYGPHFLRDRWTVWVSTSMKVVTKISEKLITMSELLTWKNNNSIISNFFSITHINLMLFNFKIVCDLHFIKFFCELFVSFFCVQAISGITGLAHGYCWKIWQLYVHASFRALSSSFFRPYLSSLLSVSRCLSFSPSPHHFHLSS